MGIAHSQRGMPRDADTTYFLEPNMIAERDLQRQSRMDTDSIRFCREDSTYLKCFPKVPLSRWQPHRSES